MKPTIEQLAKELEIYDGTQVELHISYTDAWLLLGTLQLALRHPELPELTRQRMTILTSDLEAVIALTPILKSAAKLGWEQMLNVTP